MSIPLYSYNRICYNSICVYTFNIEQGSWLWIFECL